MKKYKFFAVLLLIALLSFSVTMGTLSVFADTQVLPEDSAAISLEEDFDGTSVLVTMTEEVSEVNKVYAPSFFGDIDISSIEDLTAMTGNIGAKEYFDESKFKQILQLHLPMDSKENVLDVIDHLEEVDGVLSASPNYYASFAEIPNDTDYEDLWGMDDEDGIDAVSAWDITTGSNEVKVGIIDSGIANHPDLNANLAAGWDFVNDNSNTSDDPTGHGTHVAGTVGACGNNGVGVVGVNWEVTLVPLQVAVWNTENSDWRMSVSAVAEAITWAKDNNISILNYSAGGNVLWSAIKNALDSYTGLFICAAGNDASNNDITGFYPSDFADETNAAYSGVSDHVISVGAIDRDGDRRSTSNYGADTVSIYAPGGNILSTVPVSMCNSICSQPDSALSVDELNFKGGHVANGYHYMSGTSMAAPHVTGVAALLLSTDPTLTSAELKDIILNSADNITISVPDGSGGTATQTVKKLNAYNAVIAEKCITTNIGANAIRIDGIDRSLDGVLTIPSVVNGRTVTQLGTAAFQNQTQITELVLPDSLQTIGASAFENCTGLTNVSIPSSVTSIGTKAFAGCSALNLSVAAANPNYSAAGNILYNKDKTQLLQACNVAADLTLPISVTSIAEYAFAGNGNLQTVRIQNAPSLGDNAFADCSNLTVVHFDSHTVPTAGSHVFSGNECMVWVPYAQLADYRSAFSDYAASRIDSIPIVVLLFSENVLYQSLSVHDGELITLPEPTRTGYDFGGWYDNPDFSGTDYREKEYWDSEVSLNLYAKWDAKTYTITFDGNGGTVVGPASVEVLFGSSFTVETTATLEGNRFNGWFDGNVEYITAEGESTRPWDKAEDTTLRAEWTVESYEIQIVDTNLCIWLGVDEGELQFYDDEHYLQYGTTVDMINLVPRFKADPRSFKVGEIFSHFEYGGPTWDWNEVPDLGEDGEIVSIRPKWVKERHTIEFEELGGISFNSITAFYNDNIELPELELVGHTFSGWYYEKKDQDGNIITDAEGNPVTVKVQWTKMPDLSPNAQENHYIILSPDCKANTYKVEYDANGGLGVMAPTVHEYGTSSPLRENQFTRTNYNFQGWATTPGGAVVYGDNAFIYNLTAAQGGKVILYAVWEMKPCHIYIDGAFIEAVNYGDSVSLPVKQGMNPGMECYYSCTVNSSTIKLKAPTSYGNVQGDMHFTSSIEPYFWHVRGTQVTITDDHYTENVSDVCSTSYFMNGQTMYQLRQQGYTRIKITIRIEVREIDDGYQHIVVTAADGGTSAPVLLDLQFEHGPGYKEQGVLTHTVTGYINLSAIPQTITSNSALRLWYYGSGTFSDDWVCHNVWVNCEFVK